MSFLNPLLLWLLPAAAAPIALHLIFMRRARRVPFGDLSLLRAAYARSLPSTRLRQWLLLLLRCLLLLLLILAFARPVVHRRASAAGGAEQGIEMVILVDTSWSMHAAVRGKPRFDAGLAAALRLLGMLKPTDRAAVAPFSDRLDSDLAWAESPEAAGAALRSVQAGYRTGDIAAALKAAYHLFSKTPEAAGGSRRVIMVLTDGTKSAFSTLPSEGLREIPGFDSEITVLGLMLDGAPENASILEARPGPVEEERVGIFARTVRYGGAPQAMPLDLWLRERKVDQRSVEAGTPAGPQRPALFRLPESRSADHWGRFALRADALPPDDEYFFALRTLPRPKILLLYGNPRYLEAGRGGYFLKKLLADGKRLPFSMDAADMGRIRHIDLSDYGAVILADFRTLPEGVAEGVERYVLRGGGLWVLAGTQADGRTYDGLRRVLPAGIGAAGNIPVGGRSLRVGAPLSEESDFTERFRWDEFELQNAAVERAYALTPREDAVVWFEEGSGGPLVVSGVFGQGRVLLFGSSLDIAWSNIALKPVFAAWTDVGLRWLTRYSGSADWRTLTVGETIRRHWGGGERAPAKVQIRAPGGRRTTMLVADRKIEFSDTREPGFYYLTALTGEGDAVPEVFAVNVDRRGGEGDLSPAAQSPFHAVVSPETLQEDFLRAVYGSEARTAALALALALLLLELFLARPRRSEA